MKTLLFFCLIILFTGLPIYLLYWNLFRAVLIQRFKYRLFKVRDELRLLLISGGIGDKEKAYPLVEKFCNRAILRVEDVDLTSFFSSKKDNQIRLEVERDLEIIMNSGAETRRYFYQIIFVVMGAATANSPGILILLAPVVIFAVSALWFNKVKMLIIEVIKRGLGNIFLKPSGC
jgi:hypothetical protein